MTESITDCIEKRPEDKKADAELLKLRKKTARQLRSTFQKIDDIFYMLKEKGIVDRNIVEDTFYRNIRHILKQKPFAFSSVRRNLRRKGSWYDIVAVGENRVMVIDMKNRLDQDMIDDFLDRKIPKFRQIFPEYRDFPLIGGIGALVIRKAVSRYAEEKGLYLMTQNGEGGAMLVNRENFTAKEF